MSYKFIDVSTYQGEIDWNQVKNSGIEAAIIRVGGRYYSAGTIYRDNYALRNLKNATAAGMKIGAYFYTQAITEKEAREEARFTLDVIKGYSMDLPVIIDTEINKPSVERLNKISASQRTKCTIAFMEEVKKSGYKTGFYCGYYYLRDKLIQSDLKNYDFWLAQYTTTPFCSRKFQMWQYSSKGKVPGISGNVDMNIGYTNYWENKKPEPVKPNPPIEHDSLVVDGILGTRSIIKLQKWLGSYEDGYISGQSPKNAKFFPALASVKFGAGGSLCIKSLQAKMSQEGYVTAVDGQLGPLTIKKLQTFLNKKVLGGLAIDGVLGVKTAKALQRFLNTL